MKLKTSEVTLAARIASLMAAYAAEASLGKFRIRNPKKRLKFFTKNVSKWSRRCMATMNVQINVFGETPDLFKHKNYLMVGNHLSYLDIMVFSSIHPAVFVTSVDMGETSFLGPMAELGGSIFVERRSRAHISRDLGIISDTLRAGHDVIIFPEGTSTDGSHVRKFKKPLLMAAVDAKKDVLPFVIKYVDVDGKPFSLENRDQICWYGETGFGEHAAGILKMKSLIAEVHFLKPIPLHDGVTRHELSDLAYEQIKAAYGNPLGVEQPKEPGPASTIASVGREPTDH